MISDNALNTYFMNDLYDDRIIAESISTFRNRLYNDILKGKEYIQNNNIYSGPVKALKIDKDLNNQYGFSTDTYSIKISRNIIPFYSEKLFIENYGYGTRINTFDIMKDDKVFPRNFTLFCGNYMMFDVTLIINKNETLIFIPTSSVSGSASFSSYSINVFILQASTVNNDVWTVMLTEKSDFYYTYKLKTKIFTGNKVYLTALSQSKTYNKNQDKNYWTAYFTYNNTSMNMMVATSTTLKSDDTGEYFELSNEFMNGDHVKSSNIKCLFVKNVECDGTGIYESDPDHLPILQIPYEKNPIPLRNIIAWKYFPNSDRKCFPFNLNGKVKLTYPNIYDFSDVTKNIYNLYIEWMEPNHDISACDSYIQDYIDCYGNEYVQMKNDGNLPDKVDQYKPLEDIKYTSEDYRDSSFVGDYRAWRIDKLIKLLKDNPKRYTEFFHKIFYKNKKFITKTFTYEDSPHIYDRSIMNNIDHCEGAEECVIYFEEPHCYVQVYNQTCETRPTTLYINGVRKGITHIITFGSTSYIYFRKSYISNNEDILYYNNLFSVSDSQDVLCSCRCMERFYLQYR